MGLVTLIIDGAVAQEGQKEVGGIVTAVLILVHLLPSLAVTVRRLHDTDRTGWLVLLNCLPVLNLVLLCLRGTPGGNRYGPDPYSIAAGSETPVAAASAAGGAPTATLAASANPARRDLIAELERLGRLSTCYRRMTRHWERGPTAFEDAISVTKCYYLLRAYHRIQDCPAWSNRL